MSRQDRAYLIDPLAGYPEAPGASASAVGAEERERLQAAFRALLASADIAGARAAAEELLADDPDLLPAHVLMAQADFAEGRAVDVVTRLVPVGDRIPSYVASQLLLGRAAEQAGDIPLSYAAFRAIATRSQLAFQRLGELHPRALEILSNRLQEALRNGKLDEADKQLALMRSWGAAEIVTLEGARALAVARADRRAELDAVKELAARKRDQALLERQAELEMTVGDPGAGLQIIKDLAERHPNDPRMAEKLAAAKYRWRLSLLPRDVRMVAGKAEINKGDFAALLYWLLPQVRYARPTNGRIATDVLDHPHQEEIVRVVNLGLMDVDATLHRFSPGAPVKRGAALRSVVRVLDGFSGEKDEQVACLGGAKGSSRSAVCDTAQSCELIPEGQDCDAGSPLSGSDAVEIIRRTLKLLGTS